MSKVSIIDHMILEMRKRTGRPNVKNNGGFGESPWPPLTSKNPGKPGSKHMGVDIAGLLRHTPIPTWLSGEILHAGRIPDASASDKTYGNTVFLWPDADRDIVLLFAHAQEVLCKTGDRVQWEQEIYTQGGSGATGLNTYGVHSHVEARKYEEVYHDRPWLMRKRLDPEKVLFDEKLLKGEVNPVEFVLVNTWADVPYAKRLMERKKCFMAWRNDQGQLVGDLSRAVRIYVCGGKTDDIPRGPEIINLAGADAFETVANIGDAIKNNK
jgi:hypothetical protein